MSLAEAVVRVRERIAAAARRAGRDPAHITLVAVTKTVSVERMAQAYQLGLRDLGENRVEEAAHKIPALKWQLSSLISPSLSSPNPPSPNLPSPHLRIHMIGHLQSRKAREAIGLFDMIHSVDSVRLAEKLSRLCVEVGRVMPILLECNVSGEASKYGFAALTDPHFLAGVETMLNLPGVRVEGLMTMAPVVSDPEQTRPVFAALRQVSEQLAVRFGAGYFKHLSMGMTDDFEVAIEEGATLVRIGRALFGG